MRRKCVIKLRLIFMRYDENFVETHKLIIESLFEFFYEHTFISVPKGAYLWHAKKLMKQGTAER